MELSVIKTFNFWIDILSINMIAKSDRMQSNAMKMTRIRKRRINHSLHFLSATMLHVLVILTFPVKLPSIEGVLLFVSFDAILLITMILVYLKYNLVRQWTSATAGGKLIIISREEWERRSSKRLRLAVPLMKVFYAIPIGWLIGYLSQMVE